MTSEPGDCRSWAHPAAACQPGFRGRASLPGCFFTLFGRRFKAAAMRGWHRRRKRIAGGSGKESVASLADDIFLPPSQHLRPLDLGQLHRETPDRQVLRHSITYTANLALAKQRH
jgi:hypothetical protein